MIYREVLISTIYLSRHIYVKGVRDELKGPLFVERELRWQTGDYFWSMWARNGATLATSLGDGTELFLG